MRGRTATLAALAAGSIWAAGCGGDDATTSTVTSSSTTSTTAVATDEFITAADARCAEANAAIANLSSDGSGSSTSIQQQLDITKQTLTGLKSLGSPEDPDGSLADYYAAVKEQIDLLGQQEDALASGDSAGAEALTTQLDQAESDAQAAAETFGFDECGQSGTALSTDTSTTTTPSGTPATTTTAPPPATTTPPATTPAPVTPAPPTGGTPGSSGGAAGGTSGTGGSSGSSGGISAGG